MVDKVLIKEKKVFAKIPTGNYTGTIISKSYRAYAENTVAYIDYRVRVHGVPNAKEDPDLKLSISNYPSPGTDLARFLSLFGVEIKAGVEVDLDLPIGQQIKFDVVNTKDKEDPEKTWANISKDTVTKA